LSRTRPAEGQGRHRLYIEDGSAIDKEFYLSMLIDRGTARGGRGVDRRRMDIEKVATTRPTRSSPSRSIGGGHLAASRPRIAKALGSTPTCKSNWAAVTGFTARSPRRT